MEKVTKGRAGIRWDSVVEKIWKDRRKNQKEVLSAGKYKTEMEKIVYRKKAKPGAMNQGGIGKTPINRYIHIYGGSRKGI